MGDDTVFRILHTLAIKGLAPTGVLADVGRTSTTEVEGTLALLAGDGLVVRREGRLEGWSLTPAGREVYAEGLAAEVIVEGDRTGMEAGYERFVAVNLPFKELCTAWQLEGRPARCRDDLGVIDLSARAICDGLAAAVGRFDHYGPRLAAAKARFDAGDDDALTRPMHDSYHDIWMELHQDLLVTLGRRRSDADGS